MKIAPAIVSAAALLAAGCSGTAPQLRGAPDRGMAAVLVSGRFIAPSGETQSGRLALDLESMPGSSGEIYRLEILPKKNLLYQIEPGNYRLGPTRGIFGSPHAALTVSIEGKDYRVPWPSDITDHAVLPAPRKKIVPIGVFEVRLEPALPRQDPVIHVRLDDSLEARSRMVQDIIHEMMNPALAPEDRESAIAWSQELQNSLMELTTSSEPRH